MTNLHQAIPAYTRQALSNSPYIDEFLTQARQLYPEARKILLTAYADTEAAITSINTIELDHYLMKREMYESGK